MKRILALIMLFVLLVGSAYAEGIESVIPDDSLWGISRKEFSETHDYDFQTVEVGKAKALRQSDVNIDDRTMDVYYVFDFSTWSSDGYTYKGLSKIVYLLSDGSALDKAGLEEARQSFVDAMQNQIGAPDSTSKSVTTWEREGYKVEIGKGKFQKYSGEKGSNVAIIVSAIDIIRPVTPEPTSTPVPEHTYIPPTPKPKYSVTACEKIARSYIKSKYPSYTIEMMPDTTAKEDDPVVIVLFGVHGHGQNALIGVGVDNRTGEAELIEPSSYK